MKNRNLGLPLRSHLKRNISALQLTNNQPEETNYQLAEINSTLITTNHHDLRPNIVLCIAR